MLEKERQPGSVGHKDASTGSLTDSVVLLAAV